MWAKFFFYSDITPQKQGQEKLVYRLIIMFLSTEIFSKRRKIYSWIEEKPEWYNVPVFRWRISIFYFKMVVACIIDVYCKINV